MGEELGKIFRGWLGQAGRRSSRQCPGYSGPFGWQEIIKYEENIMRKPIKYGAVAALTIASVILFMTPPMSHHSFAVYDQTQTITMTGVMTGFVAQAKHAELHVDPR